MSNTEGIVIDDNAAIWKFNQEESKDLIVMGYQDDISKSILFPAGFQGTLGLIILEVRSRGGHCSPADSMILKR